MPLVNTLLYRLGQFAYIFGAIILIRKVFLKGTEISVKKHNLIVSSDFGSFAIHFHAFLATQPSVVFWKLFQFYTDLSVLYFKFNFPFIKSCFVHVLFSCFDILFLH